jgi:hypothetical protein
MPERLTLGRFTQNTGLGQKTGSVCPDVVTISLSARAEQQNAAQHHYGKEQDRNALLTIFHRILLLRSENAKSAKTKRFQRLRHPVGSYDKWNYARAFIYESRRIALTYNYIHLRKKVNPFPLYL